MLLPSPGKRTYPYDKATNAEEADEWLVEETRKAGGPEIEEHSQAIEMALDKMEGHVQVLLSPTKTRNRCTCFRASICSVSRCRVAERADEKRGLRKPALAK